MTVPIGLALFDRPDGVCESGWMSEGYDTLSRFTSMDVLDASTVWLTNIKWEHEAYATARKRAPWLRADTFLGFSLSSMIKELCGSDSRQQIIVALPSIHTILSRMIERLELDLRHARPLSRLIDRIELPVFSEANEADMEKEFNEIPWVGMPLSDKQSGNAQFAFRVYHLPRFAYYPAMLKMELPTGQWERGQADSPGRIVMIDPPPPLTTGEIPLPHEAGQGRFSRRIFGEPEVRALNLENTEPKAMWGGALRRPAMPLSAVCLYSMADALALEVCLRTRFQLRWVRGWLAMAERMHMYSRICRAQAGLREVVDKQAARVSGYGKGKAVMLCRPSDVAVIDKIMMEHGFEPPATYGDKELLSQLTPLSMLKAMGLPYMVAVEELLSEGVDMSSLTGDVIKSKAERAIARSEALEESVQGVEA